MSYTVIDIGGIFVFRQNSNRTHFFLFLFVPLKLIVCNNLYEEHYIFETIRYFKNNYYKMIYFVMNDLYTVSIDVCWVAEIQTHVNIKIPDTNYNF